MVERTAAVAEKKRRGGKRPGAGRKPKMGRAEVSAPEDQALGGTVSFDERNSTLSIEYTDARAAHEYWKAQLAEQEFKKRSGDLLDRAQVEQAAATVLATIAQTLRSIPDNVERVAGLTPEMAEEVERIVDSLCLSLHDKLKEMGGW